MKNPLVCMAIRLVLGWACIFSVGQATAEMRNTEASPAGPQFKATLERRNLGAASEVAQLKIETLASGYTCGVEVSWGDGQSDGLRISSEQAQLAEHVYAKEGNYVIAVSGKMIFRGIGSAFPCLGASQAIALLVGAGSTDGSVAGAERIGNVATAAPLREPAVAVNAKAPDIAAAPITASRMPTGKRVALLIGNASYGQGMPVLTNPPKDVAALQTSLRKLNFDVQVVKDGDLKEMGRAIKGFGAKAQDAQVALFYYSGHGMQARDENYLIPVGSKVESEADLEIEALPVKALIRQIEDAHPQAALILLDACRDNPVALRGMLASKGLKLVGLKAVQNPPNNSLVVYAALPGTTANDNGVFARELASQITQPNVGIRSVFDKVGAAVRTASANRQYIQRDDQLSEDIVLLPAAVPPSSRSAAKSLDAEEEAWRAAKGANSAAGYDAYLQEYPKGKYASAARIAKAGMADSGVRH